ncbi:DEBR0S6_04918g1_1 [Brettanomyces bruxellensis]|uniref:DEBR0S6_04918g1_1 n=1 Tax=Dekkera bruxellensis TaxID=5007 RepID=A0A7D9H265_DEKBR|nr:DEBR0S6_04918g1_1 [Brettanomyces bruxellensis]
MPDFVDKTFDAVYSVYQTAVVALNGAYDKAKDAGQSIMEYTKDSAQKVQLKTGDLIEKASPPPSTPPETTYDEVKQFAINHAYQIGLYGGIPLSVYTLHKLIRLFVPYKRRAQKLKDGSRYEVIVLLGPIQSNFVKKLIYDLNGRGYIVFVVVSNEKQLRLVEEEKDEDVRPLIVDFQSPTTVKAGLLRLAKFLDKPRNGIFYHLRGCIFVPDYVRIPKISKIGQLSVKEFKRVLDDSFFKINLILANGMATFLKESNNRRKAVSEANNIRIKGGYSKLLFVDFYVSESNEKRILFKKIVQNMNQMLYDELYKEYAPSNMDSLLRVFGRDPDPSKIDITKFR